MKMRNYFTVYLYCAAFLSTLMSCGESPASRDKADADNSPVNHECEDFSQDAIICNNSRNLKGKACKYSEELQKCLVKEPQQGPQQDPQQGQQEPQQIQQDPQPGPQQDPEHDEKQKKAALIIEEKKQAQKEALALLQGSNIHDYCSRSFFTVSSKKALFEAVKLLKKAADDGAQFCADEMMRIRTKSTSCIESVIGGCLDSSDYGSRFLTSLGNLQKAEHIDADFIPLIAKSLYKDHYNQFIKGVWGVKLVPRSYLENEAWLHFSPDYQDPERTTLKTAHTENLIKSWGEVIESADEFVDITSLGVPQDDFKKQLIKSIVALDRKNKPIIVRLLFGTHIPVIGLNVDIKQLMTEIMSALSSDTKLVIYIATMASSELLFGGTKKKFSWNHSKIVAADGKLLFTGGHNPFDAYLHPKHPVHDVSLKLPGDIALVAHRFCDLLWLFTFQANKLASGFNELIDIFSLGKRGDFVTNSKAKYLEFFDDRYRMSQKTIARYGDLLPQEFNDVINTSGDKFDMVIAAGRLANAFQAKWHYHYNVSDVVKLRMIKDAQRAIYISQQAIYPIIFTNDFNNAVVEELIRAMIRGVDVFILKSSNRKEISGKIDQYNSGLNRVRTFKYFIDKAEKMGIDRRDMYLKLFRHFALLATANPKTEVPNHAKVLIVDTKGSNVSSHNLYDDSHAEFEILLRNLRILLDYYSPLWFSSLGYSQNKMPLTKKNLSDYKIDEYALVQRVLNSTRKEWTLAKIDKVFHDRIEVMTDFLIEKNAKMQTITDREQIRGISQYFSK